MTSGSHSVVFLDLLWGISEIENTILPSRDLTVERRRQELCSSQNERDVSVYSINNSGFKEILGWGYVEKVLHRSRVEQAFNRSAGCG